MKPKNLFVFLVIGAVILSACSSPTPTPAPAATSMPTQKVEPSTATPSAPSGKQISSNGTGFTLPFALGTDAIGSLIPEALADPNSPDPGHPAYLQFKLQGYPVAAPDEYRIAQLQVFSASANVFAMNGDVTKLNAILAAPNMQLTQESVPQNYLLMASNLKTLNSSDGSVRGVRMVAIHGNGLLPVANDGQLVYQFHGLTSDGKYYVLINLPITAPFLQTNANGPVPAGGVAVPADGTGFPAYYQQVAGLLNAAETSGTLSPSIVLMDALVQSLKINSTAVMLPAPLPTSAAPAEPTATSAPAAACDSAQFITDVTVPDGTAFKPGEIFTKTWRLKNTGTCTWDGNYRVVADSGPGMTQSPEYLLSTVSSKSTVAPGETVDISISMQASGTAGTYQTFWRLQNGAGVVVPVAGGSNGKLFYVQIQVKGDGGSVGGNGKVTSVAIRTVQEQGSGAVCTANTTYFVYIDITSDGPATAQYRIDATDNSGQVPDGVFDSTGSPEVYDMLTLTAAETKTVSLHLVGPYSYPDKITIRVQVNDQPWQQAQVSCQ